MKKNILTVVLGLLPFFVIGQMSNFSVGAYTGPTFSWMNSAETSINSNGTNLGLQLGIQGEFSFGDRDNYALTVGMRFAFNQGGTLKYDYAGNYLPSSSLPGELKSGDASLPAGLDIKYSVNYFEMPVSLKLYTNEMGHWRYFAELPILSLNIRTKSRAELNGSGIAQEDVHISSDYRLINMGLSCGVGGSYALNSGNAVYFGLYYTHNLFDNIRNKGRFVRGNDVVSNDFKETSNLIHARIGYTF